MDILYLGHAGLYIDTDEGGILCDPWFNPAYFASWWPFPANDHVDLERIAHPRYLYISHLHRDHCDPRFLAEVVDKSATVLLPDYPVTALGDELRNLGFTDQIVMEAGQVTPLGAKLQAAIWPLVAPGDGPLGDSYLWVDDGRHRILNLNDAHPRDLEPVRELGQLDALFLQFSGAIWFPMVYEFDPKTKEQLGRSKRRAEMQRAEMFIRQLEPKAVFPSAGPPALLDDDLFEWNDLYNDGTNTFPDQTVFLKQMAEDGLDMGHLVTPGSEVSFGDAGLMVSHHPEPGETAQSIFGDKERYLRKYQARMRSTLDSERASWPKPGPDLFMRVKKRLQPIMRIADLTAEQIGGDIVLDWGGEGARLDFSRRRVVAWDQGPAAYIFRVNPSLIAACLNQQLDDWVNALFLSFRFQARREGQYNEAVYTFFKCLSPERIQFAEGYWMELNRDDELWACDGYWVQRRCPHMKADLERFATVDEKHVLTCHMHGWQFDLTTGECLNAHNRTIYRRPIEEDPTDVAQGSAKSRR